MSSPPDTYFRKGFGLKAEVREDLTADYAGWIVDLLRDLQARHRLAYLFISHDLKVVRALSDEVLVMRDGRLVEHGPAAQIFENPREPYTRALISAAFELELADESAVRS